MSPAVNMNHWFFRYKLYHIPFWFLYHYCWWSITVANPQYVAGAIFSSPYGVKNAFYVIMQAAGVYFNLYYLMPKFLEKGKYVIYAIAVILTVIITAILIAPGYYVSSAIAQRSMQDLYDTADAGLWYFFRNNTLLSSAASMTLAMSIKLMKNWIRSRDLAHTLEKEKLETELKLLKYQYNPHFLFNTINSIFFLIHKSPDKASEALAKFSDLLRHQLYESNGNRIPLSREVQYLENFIALERLRQNEHVKIDARLQKQHLADLEIAPFILMTFVENAFKHVSRGSGDNNWIDIALSVDGQTLHFSVDNSRSVKRPGQVIEYGGIGLQNVCRRLQLIYPQTHSLDVTEAEEYFSVALKLHQLKIAKCSNALS